MAELNPYVEWIQRARAFVRSLAWLPGEIQAFDHIEAPGHEELSTRNWLASKTCSLPSEIRQFVGLGTKRCTFGFRWSPPETWRSRLRGILPDCQTISGGGDLCEACGYSLFDDRTNIQSLFERIPVAAGLLKNIGLTGERGSYLKLARLDEDRELVLELHSPDGSRGVGWARTNDAEGFHRLSVTFESFLESWEAISYIAPDPKTLKPWLDPETQLLNPDLEKARRFKAILQEASRQGERLA